MICMRFVLGYLFTFFFFVLFILFTEGLLFVFFLSECMCRVFYFYVRVFVSYPVFSSYQPSLLKGRKEKRYSSLFSLKEKGKKKKKIQTLPSLFSSRNYSEPLPPLEKYTQCRNTGISSCASCRRSFFPGSSCSQRCLATAVASLQRPRGTATKNSTSHLLVLKMFPRAVLPCNLRSVCIVWSGRS